MKLKHMRAQQLVEFLLIASFIVVTGFVIMSPLGGKIANMFQGMTVDKKVSMSNSVIEKVAGNQQNFSTIQENLNILSSSSNQAAQSISNRISQFFASLDKINSGHLNQLSDNEVKGVLNEMTAETSGSLANIVISLAGEDYDNLNAEEKEAFDELAAQVQGEITSNKQKVVVVASEATSAIKAAIKAQSLSVDVFAFEGSPVKAEEIASGNIEAIINKYFSVANESKVDNLVNSVNLFNLSQSLKTKEGLSAELETKLNNLATGIADSLTVE